MRIISYLLLALVWAFIGNIALFYTYAPYSEYVKSLKGAGNIEKPVVQTVINTGVSLSDEPDIAESLEKINATMDLLLSGSGTKIEVWTGKVDAPKPEELPLPLSGILLSKIMPDILPKNVKNDGIFGIHIFNSIKYSTYYDEKKKVKVYVFDQGYDVMLSNLKLLDKVYTINETDQFFSYTFFLNPVKKDSTVRFVTFLEGRAIGMEVPKSYYPTVKKMLLKK